MEEMIAMVFELIYSCLSIVWGVLPIIGMWLVFEKAGDKGWKAIIPFYNMYTMLKLGDKKKFWGLYLAGTILYMVTVCFIMFYLMWFVFALIMAFGAVDLGWTQIEELLPVVGIAGIGALAGYIMMLIGMIQGYAGICKKMNQGAGMVIGLVFLGPVFWMLLGAGKQYQWHSAETVYQEPEYNPQEYRAPEWNDPYQQQ